MIPLIPDFMDDMQVTPVMQDIMIVCWAEKG